jgi:hypothetical protein
MLKVTEAPTCKHCGTKMNKWETPLTPMAGSTTWHTDFLYICFNDECTYFVKGFDWIWNNYHRTASYRYMVDPGNGQASPIPVKSAQHLKDAIIEE